MSSTLVKVDVPILDNGVCQKWFSEKNSFRIADTVMCAGLEEGGRDACSADSGGPLSISQSGRRLVVGVVSAGSECASPKLPGLYTRVNSYVSWISAVVRPTVSKI